MKKLFTTIAFLTSFATCFSQTITQVEDVFGGRINAITSGAIGTSTDSFRIIVSTESANSIFYATCVVPSAGPTTIDSFVVLPSANSTIGFGGGIQKIAYHATSQKVFFIANGNVYSTTTTATAATQLTISGGYIDIKIVANQLVLLSSAGTNNTINLHTLDATGSITTTSTASIIGNSLTHLVIGKNDKLYAFRGNTTDPLAIAFGGKFTTSINLGATFIDNMGSLNTAHVWAAMGVYTDGSVYVGGIDSSGSGKLMANTASFGTAYTTVNTGIVGGAGFNVEFRTGSAGNFYVYFGSAYSNNKGNAGTWNTLGNVSFMTHPNDGQVHFVAENNLTGGTLLLTTDQGLGITKNSGLDLREADKGIIAVQVKDFDMNTAKNFGWLASKSGIRYVENYNTSSKAWSRALFPNGDGAPYYACEMISEDTAYVGNLRVYKTYNRGISWTQVFTTENAPYNFPSTNNHISSIAVGGINKEVVMAGYKFENNAGKGGVFYSVDSGKNWNQLLISTTVVGQDVDVNDIEIVSDSGKVVAYIGVNYDATKSPIVRGMYKAQWDGTSWTVREENIYGAATSLFSVRDIVIYSKDTIVAGGAFYNPVLKHEYPIHFAISRTTMNQWRSSVVDTSRVGTYTAMSFKKDTIFYSYSNNIYWDRLKFYSTYTSRVGEALYYAVPIGTEINVLYYDELLAGTETDIRSVRGATIKKPTATQASRTTACAGTQITGGNPSGGVYYMVDSTANGYTIFENNRYRILFANAGIITGETSMDFAEAELSNFSTLHLVPFKPLVYYPNTFGNYAIAYSLNTYAASTVANNVSVNVFTTVQPITGSTVNCGATGSFTNLYNATPNGTWASSNAMVATVNATGKVTATGFGSTVISYTVNSGGCNAAAIANYYVAGLPKPNEIIGANSVCVGATIQLSNTTNGGVWSSIAGGATVNANGLVTGQSIGSLATIKYTIAANGCSSFVTKNITVNPTPVVPTITYAPGTTSNPQAGAPTGSFCVGKKFRVVATPNTPAGVWTATGAASIAGYDTVKINAVGAGSIKYTYTSAAGCVNSRTMNGTGYTCAARGVSASGEGLVVSGDFTMYPNPAKGLINLNVESLVGAGSIVVTDLYGKTLKTQALSMGTNTVDIANLSKGMYFVSTITNEGKTTKKLIVE